MAKKKRNKKGSGRRQPAQSAAAGSKGKGKGKGKDKDELPSSKSKGEDDSRSSAEAKRAEPAWRPGGPRWLDIVAGTDRRSTLIALGIAVLSGVLWFLSCADFDIWPLAWIAMVPALWVIERAPTRRRAFLYAWVTGIVANAGGFYWITELLTRFAHFPLPLAILGLLLLSAYQGTVFLLFGLAIRRLRGYTAERFGAPLPMALLAPLVMVTFEMIVPFIFPWYLAITQAWVVPVIQIAEITGPVGVTALLLVVNGALYDLVVERATKRRLLPTGAAVALLAGVLVFGFVRINQIEARRAEATKIKIGVVQGNIPFDEKGVEKPWLAAKQLRDLQDESAKLEAKGADLILWTESSYPYAIARNAENDLRVRHRIQRGPTGARAGRKVFSKPLILGAVTRPTLPDNPRKWDLDAYPYNSALMMQNDRIVARFDKIFLLMFGEYIPGLETFPFLRSWMPRNAGHFARGKEIVAFPFEYQGTTYRLGPMICYEDILPDFGRKLAAKHPHLLVNVTNDAWFGDTSEPWEHLALSVYRSVEVRTDMVRAVNTGVSAFIDATGRVYHRSYAVDPKKTRTGVDSIIADAALMEGGHTFYARFGDLFGWLCVIITLLGWQVWPRVQARRDRKR